MKKNFILACYYLLLIQIGFAQQNPPLNMRLLARWDDSNVPKETGWVGNRYNEVWGWFNPKDGKEYGIIGSTVGTHIIDITDIYNIHEVAFVAGKYNNAIHRDFKTLHDHYLVGVCDEGASSLQIIDMSYLPDSVKVVYDSEEIFNRSHNVYVEGNRIYAVTPMKDGTTMQIGGLAILDASNPNQPTLLKQYEVLLYGKLHDLHVRDNIMYANAGNRGLYVVDASDVENPITIAYLTGYPYAGYNHSGWLNDAGNTYVMADENHGLPIKIIDVSKKDDPQVLSFAAPNMIVNPPANQPIPHNPLVKGNTAFVSYYYHGVQAFDVSEPASPKLVGSYDTYPDNDSMFYAGAWGVYPFLPSGHILASDTEYGLYVLGFDSDSAEKASVQVYPNHWENYIKFYANKTLASPTLKIYNALGQILYSRKIDGEGSEFYVPYPNLSSNVLFWTIEDENKLFFSGKCITP